jgi:hypothetical protein
MRRNSRRKTQSVRVDEDRESFGPVDALFHP